mmetsp:Transcript_22101/g.55727  ORF Transcript_22101/g.55727 Transcript_22101/m.55727 type:complete len:211 (-) Transcript_22101:2249-2881(-)
MKLACVGSFRISHAIMNEKIILWSSNSPRQMLLYTDRVTSSMMMWIRFAWSSDFSDFCSRPFTSAAKYSSEYWYIGSIRPMYEMQKYNIESLVAVGLSVSVTTSIFVSVSSAAAMRFVTSAPVTLDAASVLISLSSSKISPFDSASSFRISASSLSISALSAAICTTSAAFCSLNSWFSLATTSATSWFSSPFGVTVKLITVTLMQISGR